MGHVLEGDLEHIVLKDNTVIHSTGLSDPFSILSLQNNIDLMMKLVSTQLYFLTNWRTWVT